MHSGPVSVQYYSRKCDNSVQFALRTLSLHFSFFYRVFLSYSKSTHQAILRDATTKIPDLCLIGRTYKLQVEIGRYCPPGYGSSEGFSTVPDI